MNYTIDTFDWEYYIGEYVDLRNANVLTRKRAWKHWRLYGSKENRRSRSIVEKYLLDKATEDKSNIDFICYFDENISKTYISSNVNKNFAIKNNFNYINLAETELNDKLLNNYIITNQKNTTLIVDNTSLHLLYKTKNYKMFDFLERYKIYNMYLKCFLNFMDFHDYSLEEITGIGYSYDYKHGPKLFKNIYKEKLYNYIINNKLNILSWTWSPEVMYFSDTFKIPIYLSNMYLYYDCNIFKSISDNTDNKTIDILSCGNIHEVIYSLRYSIYKLVEKHNFKTFRYKMSYDNLEKLKNCINSSWITISCTSIYYYFVRKYIEILQCGSVPAGDITNEGLYIIGYNFIYLDLKMSNEYILDKLSYYISNKNILINIVKQGKEQINNRMKELNINNTNHDILCKTPYLIQEYNKMKIYDFLHVYDNCNKLGIINLDDLSSITCMKKIDILGKINKIIIILSENNEFDLYNENTYKNYIIIKTDNLETIYNYLRFCKVCIYIKTGDNYDSNISLLKKNGIIVIKEHLDNRYNNIIYYNTKYEIHVLLNEIYRLNITICNINKFNYIIIGIGSGQIDYGGIAVVCKKLYLFMFNLNYNVKLFLYGNSKNEVISENFNHNAFTSFYVDMKNNINKNTKIILLNWLPDLELKFIQKLENNSHFFVPGMINDNINNWINSIELSKNDYHLQNIKTIQHVNSSSFCSNLIKKIYNKFNDKYNDKYNDNKYNDNLIFYDNGIYHDFNNFNNFNNDNKIYDIGFIVSDFRRSIKNVNMVYDIIKYYCLSDVISLNILLIGQNIDKTILNIQKTDRIKITYFNQLNNEECVDYISKTKIVLCTSFFDACPTVLFECMINNTIFITTNNCGAIDHIKNKYIVNDYKNINSWVKIINNILNNSNNMKKSIYNICKNKLSLLYFEYLVNGNHDILTQFDNNTGQNIKDVWFDNISDVFKETFDINYDLNQINDINKLNDSCVFFGISQASTLKKIEQNKNNINIIIFIGSDSYFFLSEKDKGHLLPYINNKMFFKNNFFIAISPWILEDLKKMGVPETNYRQINLLGSNIHKILNTNYIKQRGDHVYCYTSLSQTYNLNLVKKIYKKLILKNNKIKFYICTNPLYYDINKDIIEEFNSSNENIFYPNKLVSFKRDELYTSIYPNVFIGMRLTDHDGNSNTVCELGGLGIKCIHNGNQPNCIKWNKNNLDEIVDKIIYEYENREIDYKYISQQIKEYLQESIDIPWRTNGFWR